PGTLQHTAHISGNGGETQLSGNIYTYDITGLSFTELSNIPYWLSVVPDLDFPPQWGWATSGDGDGTGYQTYFGQGGAIPYDSAFPRSGRWVPEPGRLVRLGTGVIGLAGALRRKLF